MQTKQNKTRTFHSGPGVSTLRSTHWSHLTSALSGGLVATGRLPLALWIKSSFLILSIKSLSMRSFRLVWVLSGPQLGALQGWIVSSPPSLFAPRSLALSSLIWFLPQIPHHALRNGSTICLLVPIWIFPWLKYTFHLDIPRCKLVQRERLWLKSGIRIRSRLAFARLANRKSICVFPVAILPSGFLYLPLSCGKIHEDGILWCKDWLSFFQRSWS